MALDRKETEGAVWRIWFLTLGFKELSELFGRKWVELGILWSWRVLKITEQRERFPLECVWSPGRALSMNSLEANFQAIKEKVGSWQDVLTVLLRNMVAKGRTLLALSLCLRIVVLYWFN